MGFEDTLKLLHPAIAVVVVFPLIGMVVRMAWLTRQRRLQVADDGKSRIPPGVGQEHLKLGQWLAAAVVGVELLGITRPMFSKIAADQIWSKDPTKVILILAIYVVTISSLVFLYKARQRLWRGIFATLTGAGVVVLSFQDGIYRRDIEPFNEWYVSHFYYGLTAALLMIFSLAIIQDIYQDRTNRWRTVHIVLNCIALLLFIGQGVTGTRDLLEIPLSWQGSHLGQCDFINKKCPEPAPPPPQSQIPLINPIA
ncbi:MAG: DUF4079 domain-containing protein [Leptolyngbyaceae cyanobacterium RU_5_1]|nr:DUF4079 domain-containing protein [Leptolyngbyaceae cyanobacterium RU_5_1]